MSYFKSLINVLSSDINKNNEFIFCKQVRLKFFSLIIAFTRGGGGGRGGGGSRGGSRGGFGGGGRGGVS